MKKICLLFIMFISLGFIVTVNAEEKTADMFSINVDATNPIDGQKESIIETEENLKMTYYYKYVPIDSAKFSQYTAALYGVENLDSTSSEYTQATTTKTTLETEFAGLIPAVTSPAGLKAEGSGWNPANGKVIALSDLTYVQGQHSGYLLAVAGVKDGDTANVYAVRIALESVNATTLGAVTFLDADKAAYQQTNPGQTTPANTEQNPSTGIEDYALYLVPVSIILGSVIMFKKDYVY